LPPSGVNATGFSYIASILLDLTLYDSIPQFDKPVSICYFTFYLSFNITKQTPLCLGYVDESYTPSQWICETNMKWFDNDTVCGTTTHFTNFGVLFGSSLSGQDGSSSSASGGIQFQSSITQPEVGAAVGASVAVVVAVAAIAIGLLMLRRRRQRRNKEKQLLAQKMATNASDTSNTDSKRATPDVGNMGIEMSPVTDQ